jgi:hypothetical protein
MVSRLSRGLKAVYRRPPLPFFEVPNWHLKESHSGWVSSQILLEKQRTLEARNSKHEIRNKFKTDKSECSKRLLFRILNFCHSDLFRASNFGFRIWFRLCRVRY